MDNTIAEQNQDLQMHLGMVDFKLHYVLSKASIGQIMVCFQNVLKIKPKNQYEEKLYAIIIPEITKLVDQYNEMLFVESYSEMIVRYYNLLINLPIGTSINDEEHGKIKMKNPKIGFLIQAAKQRLRFLLDREIPEIYKINNSLLDEFNILRDDVTVFYNNMVRFEKIFSEFFKVKQ